MGIIQKQTLKGSVYSYIGVVIGFINMGILFPRIFSAEEIGLTQVMLSIATILSQVGNLGFIDVSNRLFPWFRDGDSKHRGFLGLGLLVTLAGTVLVTVLLILNIDYIIHSNVDKTSLLEDYAGLIPLLLILLIWFNFFDNYVKVLYNAVLGTFLRDLLLRVLNMALIGLYFFEILDFEGFILLYVLNQGLLPVAVLAVYLARRGELHPGKFWLWIDKDMIKQLVYLSFYGLVAGISSIAVSNIDKYMINYHLGLDQAGIYAISFYFATVIMIPGKALGKIAIPVLADAWKRNDAVVISQVYTKSCINQIAIGVLLIVGILSNIDNIYRILPAEYAGGEWIIILVSFSNFISNATGASVYVLGTSQHYRIQTYLMVFLIVLVVVTNYFLIPAMGIEGAALASVISVLVNSSLRVYVIYLKTGLWPFSLKNLLTIGVGIVVYLVAMLIPVMPLIPDIIVRSGVISILFLAAVYFLNLSDEMKGIMKGFLFPRSR